MTITSCKVFPISITQAAKCCICYEYKNSYKVCTNQKCSDGIICFDCLEKMDSTQKEMCQICRTKMDIFKSNVKIQPIHIYIDHDRNNNTILYRSKQDKCCLLGFIKIIASVALILIFSYTIGLVTVSIILNLNIKIEIQNMNPFLYIFIGLFIMGSLTFCCSQISLCIKKNDK